MLVQRLINLGIFVSILVGLWFVRSEYPGVSIDKLFYSVVAYSIAYLLFRVFLEGAVAKRIMDHRARYSFRKTSRILFLIITGIVVLRIWIVNPQALLVAYGLIAAGVAISLQDIFKNFAGGITILTTGLYQVGNRIEINGKYGDVIDISIFYTTILEIKEWVGGDQATGRLSMIPNGVVLSQTVNNYTKDHHFLWDEISFPITYGSNWKEALMIMRNVASREANTFTDEAKRSLSSLEERYYLSERSMEPSVYVEATSDWATLTLRYVVEVRERRVMRNKLTMLILEGFDHDSTIEVSTSTLSVFQNSSETKKQPRKKTKQLS